MFIRRSEIIDPRARNKSSVRTSSLARGATAAFEAGMKLLDNSAQARICLTHILRIRGVHQLVAVMVHLYSAARAHHFVMVGHNRHLPSRRSVQRDLLAPVPQRLCHPDEFLRELINSPSEGFVE